MRSAQASVVELDKGKRYRVYVELPRDPQTGKRRRMTRTVRGSRKEAERVKGLMLAQAQGVPACDMTLEEYVETEFLPRKEAEVKQLTYETYRGRLEKHVLPLLGSKKLGDVTASDVRAALSSIGSPNVEKEARRTLHMVFQMAVYDDAVRDNPVARVKPPRTERYRPEVLTADEVVAYMEHFRGSLVETAVLVILGCGLRRGEAVALDVEDVDPETGAVTVDDSIVPTSAGTLHGPTKTENGVRTVHMPRIFLDRLLEIMPASGPLVRNMNGTRMAPGVLTHRFIRERDKLPEGVTRVSLKEPPPHLAHARLRLGRGPPRRLPQGGPLFHQDNVGLLREAAGRPRREGRRDDGRRALERLRERLKTVENRQMSRVVTRRHGGIKTGRKQCASDLRKLDGAPNGNRTRVSALKGPRPDL